MAASEVIVPVIDCVAFCRALSDSTRQDILELLKKKDELCVSGIVAAFSHISQPTISHHLKILTHEGLVKRRRKGKEIFYALNEENVEECCGVLWNKFRPAKSILVRLASKKSRPKRTRAAAAGDGGLI
jgi:ArsR family transcriptional regulator